MLGRGRSLPEAMVEPSMTCTTVDGVAACGIRGGTGSRSRVRARKRNYPRPSSASGKAEICARGLVCFSRHVRCPIGGMVGDVRAQWQERNHAVVPGDDRCLVSYCASVPLRGIGVCINCECPPSAFGRLCPICLGLARARRMEWW
jgi:hypothetical protein